MVRLKNGAAKSATPARREPSCRDGNARRQPARIQRRVDTTLDVERSALTSSPSRSRLRSDACRAGAPAIRFGHRRRRPGLAGDGIRPDVVRDGTGGSHVVVAGVGAAVTLVTALIASRWFRSDWPQESIPIAVPRRLDRAERRPLARHGRSARVCRGRRLAPRGPRSPLRVERSTGSAPESARSRRSRSGWVLPWHFLVVAIAGMGQ